jgi:hypothetical protein
MLPQPTAIRVHRILGSFAVSHSAALLVWLLIAFVHYGGWPLWVEHLWLGLAGLWFFWPVVLALHHGRSLLRFVLPVLISVAFVALWIRHYVSMARVALDLLPKDRVF